MWITTATAATDAAMATRVNGRTRLRVARPASEAGSASMAAETRLAMDSGPAPPTSPRIAAPMR